jgi:hypothetical protein
LQEAVEGVRFEGGGVVQVVHGAFEFVGETVAEEEIFAGLGDEIEIVFAQGVEGVHA